MSDARFELWERRCRCNTYDIRMCMCSANFALACEGCGRGYLLPKTGPRGTFWGCSNYKKGGCKYTKKWGPPYDAAARMELEGQERSDHARAEAERAEMDDIQDPFELEWRSQCRCDGAKDRSTFECYMRSEGGCSMLPLCPEEGCGGVLFLKGSRYGQGKKWWGCSQYKGGCTFTKNYVPHKSEEDPADAEKRAKRKAAEEEKAAKAEAQEKKKRRREVPIEAFEWRAPLAAGELDDETAKFLKDLLRVLKEPLGGKQPELLARLKAYAAKNQDSKEQKSTSASDGNKTKGSVEGTVSSTKKSRKALEDVMNV